MFIKQYLVIDDHPTVQVDVKVGIPDPVLDRQDNIRLEFTVSNQISSESVNKAKH